MRPTRYLAASLLVASLATGAAWAQQQEPPQQNIPGQQQIDQGQQQLQQQQPRVGQGFGVAGVPEAAVTPQAFSRMTAHVNQFEVKSSELAESKSNNDQVKNLAKSIQQDHQNLASELQNICTSKNIQLPESMGPVWKSRYDQLNQLSGTAFDQQYVRDLARSHKMAINLFEAEAQHGTDADLKAFAARTLPHLQEHLRMIEQTEAALGVTPQQPAQQENQGAEQGQQQNQLQQQQEQPQR